MYRYKSVYNNCLLTIFFFSTRFTMYDMFDIHLISLNIFNIQKPRESTGPIVELGYPNFILMILI